MHNAPLLTCSSSGYVLRGFLLNLNRFYVFRHVIQGSKIGVCGNSHLRLFKHKLAPQVRKLLR